MTHDYDRLIERYMGGRMSAAEEREFLSLAGSDERLAHLLDAERAITSGTQKERTRMPAVATSPGAHLLAKLAATPAAPAAVTGMMALKNGTVQTAIAAVALLGIIIGAIFIAPLITKESQPAETAAPAPVVRSASPSPALKEEGTSITPRSVPETAAGGPASAASGSVRERKPSPPAPHRPAAQEAPEQKTFPLDEGTSPPAVFDNDTVRVKMNAGSGTEKE